MKTFYLIKSLLPLIFLPVAPSMLQVELARLGLMTGNWAIVAVVAQGILTLCTLGWVGYVVSHRQEKAFLRMSCISKKVYFQGRWMSVEQYLAEHHNVVVSHGMTPEESEAWVADAEAYLRREHLAMELEEGLDCPELEETVA